MGVKIKIRQKIRRKRIRTKTRRKTKINSLCSKNNHHHQISKSHNKQDQKQSIVTRTAQYDKTPKNNKNKNVRK